MTALMTAGTHLIGGGRGYSNSVTPVFGPTLGVRSLREDYAKPVNRPAITMNLSIIEERLLHAEGIASDERQGLQRFSHLFKGGQLFPPGVFVMALGLSPSEVLNGRSMPFDAEVLILRDNLVAAYKPLVSKVRALNSREISELPPRMVQNFAQAWAKWERSWLQNCEVHAVEALQPLAKAILSLEPLLLSIEKEKLLPWPRVKHQKVVTLKCLEGFVHSLSDLAACVLPSLKRELDPDPRLLLLMDHVLMLRGDRSVPSCLHGTGATPEVAFPEHQTRESSDHSVSRAELMSSVGLQATQQKGGRGVGVDMYAFKLLGASVGDAVAAGKVHVTDGRPPTTEAPMTNAAGGPLPMRPAYSALRETDPQRKAAALAAEMLAAFEGVKDMLLSLKSTLDFIDPALDRDEAFVAQLQRFERAFRRAKRFFLEPDNLA
eukprot:TRINITY_DN102125_c0_g1_i1.p1 TRINITY_DN102125_c0_g1~~TRINITY_DN102125_c0_g1_i1.p1  ORF type:complete len:434 (+),score=106.52 TRINITY_DN102125_c0_g1_i1:114-1415(+)